MTEIERKALALVNEVQAEEGYTLPSLRFKRSNDPFSEALCRAIEQHEAFRQEVSDAAVKAAHTMAAGKLVEASGILAAFIIAKPDPLVEALAEAYNNDSDELDAANVRAAIEKRGGKIVWGETP